MHKVGHMVGQPGGCIPLWKTFHRLLFFFPHNEGKGDSVSGEEQQKFAELCDKMRIPKEKIRYMFEKGKQVAIEGTLGVPWYFIWN